MEHVLLQLTYSMIHVFVDILKKVRFSLIENFWVSFLVSFGLLNACSIMDILRENITRSVLTYDRDCTLIHIWLICDKLIETRYYLD